MSADGVPAAAERDDSDMVLDLLESVDKFAPLRNGLRRMAEAKREWAGIPMPLDDLSMTIEPNYPRAAELCEIGAAATAKKLNEQTPEGVEFRNSFWSHKLRCQIMVWKENGKIYWGPGSLPNNLDIVLNTLGAADAWGVEQEATAVQTLGGLLRHRPFKTYLMTGSFLERSKRSGVMYVFRRLRPTIALSMQGGSVKPLAALCMHPIGYYDRSWSGVMCPTDDVIAHLMLMRGDEPMFWRRCNQHPISRPEAGV